jgi:hypothetical protein
MSDDTTTSTTPPSGPAQTGDPSTFQAQIVAWTGYTQYLLAADGLLRATEGLCKKALSAGTFHTVAGVIGAAHVALQGVDKQLIDGITSMKSGNAPEYDFEPSPVPDWPTDPGSEDVFAGAWESIKAVLEKLLSTSTPSSALGVALAGLIDRGDDVVAALQKAFD